MQALTRALLERRRCDWQVARRLYHLVRDAGFWAPQVAHFQPVYVRGEEKRFEVLSFREMADRMLAAGLASAQEVRALADEAERLTLDDGVVYTLARMTQVWAIK